MKRREFKIGRRTYRGWVFRATDASGYIEAKTLCADVLRYSVGEAGIVAVRRSRDGVVVDELPLQIDIERGVAVYEPPTILRGGDGYAKPDGIRPDQQVAGFMTNETTGEVVAVVEPRRAVKP